MRKATVHNRHTKIHFIQSTPIHLLVCYGSNYGSHVTATEVDELCVRKDHNADAKQKENACHIHMLAPRGVLSAGAPISSQRLFHYATSQEKSETNTTKLHER